MGLPLTSHAQTHTFTHTYARTHTYTHHMHTHAICSCPHTYTQHTLTHTHTCPRGSHVAPPAHLVSSYLSFQCSLNHLQSRGSLPALQKAEPATLPLPGPCPVKTFTQHHSYLVCLLLNSELPRSADLCIRVCPWTPSSAQHTGDKQHLFNG